MLLTCRSDPTTIAANSDHIDIGQRHHTRCHWSAKHWTAPTNRTESTQRTTFKDNRLVQTELTSEIYTNAVKSLCQTPPANAYVNRFVYNSCHSVATTTIDDAARIVCSRVDNRNCINACIIAKSKCWISDKSVKLKYNIYFTSVNSGRCVSVCLSVVIAFREFQFSQWTIKVCVTCRQALIFVNILVVCGHQLYYT